MTRLKHLITVIAVSVILTACTVLLIVFDPAYVMHDNAGKVISLIIVPLWAFSAVPAYTFAVCWAAEKLDFQRSVWLGYCLGITFPLLIAPVLMVFYFVGTIENLIRKK